MYVTFSHAKIAGVVATPGSVVRRLDDEVAAYGGDLGQIERIKKTVGLAERRVVPEGVTTLDLCDSAARELIELISSAALPDAVIFVTQTPDYLQPGNATLLHGKLGLPKTTLAFDVSLGCSGYVYGLYLSFLMVEHGGCERVLLCAGDTMSQCVHPLDRATTPLFGDAGSATLVERTEQPFHSWFLLGTDGAGADAIKIPAGAFRQPHTEETAKPEKDVDGNTRTLEKLHMDGAAVFNFSLREVPASIRQLIDFSGKKVEDLDAFVLHQANKYILNNIAKRCSIPVEKMPVASLARFGNTSSASIPVAICAELEDSMRNRPSSLLLSGFGSGLSWANAVVEMPPYITKILEK